MSARSIVFLIMAFASVFNSAMAAPPNVVLIISDDQAWTDFGFMGHTEIKTPHLDRLASESLTFSRGYVPTSLCRPSLTTIVSGLYANQHKISGNDPTHPSGSNRSRLSDQDVARYLPAYNRLKTDLISHIDRVPTLGDMLGKAGYLSHQSGKWWEGNFKRGGFTHGMTRGFPEPGGRHGDDGLKIGREGLAPVLDFVDMSIRQKKPFFVYYAPFLPHSPHTPPKRLLEKYVDKTDSLFVAKYWAMCEWFDETCGELLGHLDKRNVAKDTIVLFVTDNGWIQETESRRYAARSKQTPFEGGIRTPIMVRWPDKVAPAMDNDTLVSSIDLTPTILAACGLPTTKEMSGLNLLDGNALAKRKTLYGEDFSHDVADVNRPAASLEYRWCIDRQWKLILPNNSVVGADQHPLLFDVVADPFEKNDLAAEKPELVVRLTDSINSWWDGAK